MNTIDQETISKEIQICEDAIRKGITEAVEKSITALADTIKMPVRRIEIEIEQAPLVDAEVSSVDVIVDMNAQRQNATLIGESEIGVEFKQVSGVEFYRFVTEKYPSHHARAEGYFYGGISHNGYFSNQEALPHSIIGRSILNLALPDGEGNTYYIRTDADCPRSSRKGER